MKSITIKVTDEKMINPESGQLLKFKINTLTFIKTAINNTPPGGFAVSDMMNRIKLDTAVEDYEGKMNNDWDITLIDADKREMIEKLPKYEQKLYALEGVLELEDALFEKLGEYVAATKWGFISKNIVAFEQLFTAKN